MVLNCKILKSVRRVACHNQGAQHRFVGVERAIFAAEPELDDLSGEKALGVAVELGTENDLDAHVLALQAFGRAALRFADQPNPVLEQVGDLRLTICLIQLSMKNRVDGI